jgi:hypothetical protein
MALSYRKAWKLLEKSTPLTSDCGTLCGGACCKGSGEEGMLLFPHEELMYASCPDGFTIRDSNITLASGYHVKFLTCRVNAQETRDRCPAGYFRDPLYRRGSDP